MRHSLAPLCCTDCGGAMTWIRQVKIADFECEECLRVLNESDLDLDPGESISADSLDDGRVYIITCPKETS